MAASEAANDAFCRNDTSTISSGRSEVGKNCCSTKRIPQSEPAKASTVTPMVSQRKRIAARTATWKARRRRPGSAVLCFIVAGRNVTPMIGANSTATIHEITSETAITTNSENVYSPAAEEFSPMGMNPATVTSVPDSIGKAIEVQA